MPATSGKNPNPLLLEYVCSNCGTHLKTTEAHIDRLEVTEDCPSCGKALSQTLAIRNQSHFQQKPVTRAHVVNHAEFVIASTYPRLKFGIPALDKTLSPLVAGDMLCISGPSATAMLEILCCQSLLPVRSGGLESERVVYLDAGNTSEIYRFVRLARYVGLDHKNALRRVVQTRVFTIHQLASIVINELESTAKSANAKVIFISDLFELFIREQNLDAMEAERLTSEMAKALSRLASKHILAISITRPSIYDRFLLSNSSTKRLDLASDNGHDQFHSYYHGQRKVSLRASDNVLLAEV